MRSSRYFASVSDVDGKRMEGPFLIHPYECLLMGTGWTGQAPLREMSLVHLSSVTAVALNSFKLRPRIMRVTLGSTAGVPRCARLLLVVPVLDKEEGG